MTRSGAPVSADPPDPIFELIAPHRIAEVYLASDEFEKSMSKQRCD
jgi:hypothetical protein